ncbi:hypothetical protein SAMN02910289_01902 [Lachnospiraceae bacterium RM5]|nr:hypothetical protein SAMN02910289_01902 [Lachnospiraceae bacterium RM5]
MEMCYDGTLVMPSNYVFMSEDEMMYLDGGWDYKYSKNNIAVPIKKMYLSKNVCTAFAISVIATHRAHWYSTTVNGMGVIRIASELYAHALGYYSASLLKKIGVKASIVDDIRECGSVADIGLGDGLDLTYSLIWNVL